MYTHLIHRLVMCIANLHKFSLLSHFLTHPHNLELMLVRSTRARATGVGTCSPGQVDPTGMWKEYRQSSSRDGNNFVDLASQGHCTGVFIGTRVTICPLSKTFMPSSTRSIPKIFLQEEVTDCHYRKGYYRRGL
jgi:hypothetical protein